MDKKRKSRKDVKSFINSIKNNPNRPDFIQRLYEKNLQYIPTKDGFASHLMGWEEDDELGAIVFPNIQRVDGNLTIPQNGYQSAIENHDYIPMSENEAKWFTENYKAFFPATKRFAGKDGAPTKREAIENWDIIMNNQKAYGGYLTEEILPEKYVMKRRLNRRKAAFGIPTSPMEALAQDNIYRDTAMSQASQVIDPITAGINQGLDLAGELLSTIGSDQWAKGAVGGTSSKWYQANKSRFAPAAYGNPQQNIPVEVEGGETAQLPNGEMIGFNGNLHENGGIDVDLPEGTEIYSQRLTKDGETLAERKLKRERTMDRVRRKQNKRSTDNLYNNTVNRLQMIADYQEAQDQAYQDGVRNLVNQIYGEDSGIYPQFNAACGGRVKAAYSLDDDPKVPLKKAKVNIGKGPTIKEETPFGHTVYGIGWAADYDKNGKLVFGPSDYVHGDSYNGLDKWFDTHINTQFPPYYQSEIGVGGYSVPQFDKKTGEPILSGTVNNYEDLFKSTMYAPGKRVTNLNFDTPEDLQRMLDESRKPKGIKYNPETGTYDYLNPFDDINFAYNFAKKYWKPNPHEFDEEDTNNNSKFNWNNFLSSATLGNLNVLAGNMYQGIAPYLTTLKQREGDMPNVNTFRDYNKDAIRSIQDAMDASVRTRDTQLADLELRRRSDLNAARNLNRGANGLAALSTAIGDTYNQGTEKVYNAYQDNYNKLLAQLSGLQSDRDLKYMTAEDQRNERDTQDRDAFYRNLAKDNAEIGKAIAQSGKSLNDMRKASQEIWLTNLLSQEGYKIDYINNRLLRKNEKGEYIPVGAYGGRVRRTSSSRIKRSR